MEKLHFSIVINASKEKVWNTMLNKETYMQWTEVFNPNPSAPSTYEGDWNTGSDIKFLAPEEDGTKSGMISRIAESRPFDFVSVQHLGEMSHGQIKMYPSQPEMFENYTFNEKDGGTEVLVDLDTVTEYKAMFEDMWPKALVKLKQIAEK